MVGFNMNGPSRDQLLKFMEEKDKIEQEIQELNLVLETNMNVGMDGSLVDADNYPRGDIDVYRVRHARHRIICLQNDHKEVMKHIERGLHNIHHEFDVAHGEGTSRSHLSNGQPMNIAGGASMQVNGNGHVYTNGYHNGVEEDSRVAFVVEATNNLRVSDRAFVKISLVSTGSPADSAGIQVDDEIMEFGSVNSSNFNNLSQLADIVQHSVGARVNIRLRRGQDMLNVTIVPRTWAGRGLLGCNIIPI